MILKLLLVVGVIATVYFMFIKKKPSKNANHSNKDANDMIQCENCGVYSELKDSILSNTKYYCSKECLEEASK